MPSLSSFTNPTKNRRRFLALFFGGLLSFSMFLPVLGGMGVESAWAVTVNPTAGLGSGGGTVILPPGTGPQPGAEVKPPGAGAFAVDTNTATARGLTSASSPAPAQEVKYKCGIGGVDDVLGCLPYFVEEAIYKLSRQFLFFSGMLTDAFLAMSLSSDFVRNKEFVDFGWVITRDIANTMFIFVLLYIAIMTIIGGGGSTKKLLVTLVAAALITNFSLYLTRFVIDASNIVALEFYKNIGTTDKPLIEIKGIETRSISNGFVYIGADKMADRAVEYVVLQKPFAATGVLILASILNVAMFFIFLSAAFIFLGRMVALWFVMIFAPLAIVCSVIPGMSGQWNTWKRTLADQAVVAPIVLFFFYLGYAFLGQANRLGAAIQPVTQGVTDKLIVGMIEIIIVDVLPVIIVFAVFSYALKMGREKSGQFGQMAEKYGKTGLGVVVGGAATVGAFAGRNVVGRGVRAFGETKVGQRWRRGVNRSGFMRFTGMNKLGEKMANASYDVRGVGLVNKGLGAVSGAVGGGAFGVGKAGTGHVTRLEADYKDRKKEFESLKNDPAKQAKYFNSLSFRDKQELMKGMSASDQLSLEGKLKEVPGYDDRTFLNVISRGKFGRNSKEHIEKLRDKMGSMSPKLDEEMRKLEVSRAKEQRNETTGEVTSTAAQERLRLLGEAPESMQGKILESLNTSDAADLMRAASGTEQKKMVNNLINKMETEKREKLHAEIIKRETDVAKQLAHFVSIEDETTRQQVFSNLSTGIQAQFKNEAGNKVIKGLNPVAEAAQKASQQKAVQDAYGGLNTESQQKVDNTAREAKKKQENIRNIEEFKKTLKDIQNTGAATDEQKADIKNRMAKLNSKQKADLSPEVLYDPVVREHIQYADMREIASRGEMEPEKIRKMTDEIAERMLRGGNVDREALRQLRKDDSRLGYLSEKRRKEIDDLLKPPSPPPSKQSGHPFAGGPGS